MQTNLIPLYQNSEKGQRAEEILRSCVHCGFCNATCPTYQALGDELDGPRGRIYQIKQLLEGEGVGEQTRKHLDRCLTCRACETTCPSGVRYHELLDIGRQALEQKVSRTQASKRKRALIHAWLLRPKLFAISLRMGRLFRAFLPEYLKAKVPPVELLELPLKQYAHEEQEAPEGSSTSRRGTILVFGACVQDLITPQVNQATRIVFKKLGFGVEMIGESSCCGALSQHMDAQAHALDSARRNIDAWLQQVERYAAVAIVANASGCGVFIKDYPELFSQDDPYYEKAKRLSSLCKDPVELLNQDELVSELKSRLCFTDDVLAYHPPCTLQHGQGLQGMVEALFSAIGKTVLLPRDAHLCCGSAGAYSLLEPELSETLRNNKVDALSSLQPDLVLTANIGCQSHLAGKNDVPVVHWLQYLALRIQDTKKL